MAGHRRLGRPPKPARLRRTRRLQLLLTAAEHRALNRYAAQQGMSTSEVVRGCLRRLLEGEPATQAGPGVAAKGGPGI